MISIVASGCGGKDTQTIETEDGQKIDITTEQGKKDSWCPVGSSWKMSNPASGEEVSLVYTGTKEIDGVKMCIAEYKSNNPEDKVAKVEYMFSEDNERFSWISYDANGKVLSKWETKDGKTTFIDESGQIMEFESGQ